MWFMQWQVWPALILTSRWKSVCLSLNQVSWTLSPKKKVNLLKRWPSSPNSPNLHLWRIPWSQPHTFGRVPQCCTCHPPRASSEEKTFSENEILWNIHDNVPGTSVSWAFLFHIWSQKCAILIWTPCFLDIVSNTLQKNVPPGKVSGKAVQPQRRDLWAVLEHSWELLRDRKSEQWTALSSPPPLSSLRPRHHWKV